MQCLKLKICYPKDLFVLNSVRYRMINADVSFHFS